ncbi:hypothetical protein P9112_012296 [Eukaryota sp. TZLM1-RC]
MSARLCALKQQPISLTNIRDAAKSHLLDQLKAVHGPKALAIDPELIGPIKLVVLQEDLRAAGITAFYSLSSNLPSTAPPAIFFIARPTPQNVYKIADSKSSCGDIVQGSSTRRMFKILFVPHVTQVCTRLLEQRNVLSSVKLSSFPLNLVPLDNDIVSLEHQTCFKRVFVDGDTSTVYQIARSILDVEQRHGIILKIVALGKQAITCAEAIKRFKSDSDVNLRPVSPEIERLVLIDRTVDLVSPMCTQLTYEGLVDEIIGISSTSIQLPPSIHGKEVPKALNSNDICFAEFRDLNFAALLPILHSKASSITATVEELERLKNSSDAKLEDVQELWNNVPTYLEEKKLLPDHVSLAEYLVNETSSTVKGRLFHRRIEHEQSIMGGSDGDYLNFVDELIGRGEPLPTVLRLLCLYSQITGGIKKSLFEQLKKDILLEYGFHHLFTLNHIEKLGLIKIASKSNWGSLKAKLKLVNEASDETNPTDMDFVYSGYCPLSCRLIQKVINNLCLKKPTFEGIEDLISKICPFSEFDEELLPGTYQAEEEQTTPLNFVFFIGGVTHAEASALRWLCAKGLPVRSRLLLGTSHITNGSKLVSSLFEGVPGV